MKRLSVKGLIDFRRGSNTTKRNFVERMKSSKIKVPTEGGGNYWISCLSAICKSYRDEDLDIVDEKMDELQGKLRRTKHSITKDMYQRNISILERYKRVDLKRIRVSGKLGFLRLSTGKHVLTIRGLEVEVKPSLVFAFGKTGEEKIAAIWFIAKVEGYSMDEVGMFCDVLYRYLRQNYGKKFAIAPKLCLAMEMISGHIVDYSQLESGGVGQALASTLDEINRLL